MVHTGLSGNSGMSGVAPSGGTIGTDPATVADFVGAFDDDQASEIDLTGDPARVTEWRMGASGFAVEQATGGREPLDLTGGIQADATLRFLDAKAGTTTGSLIDFDGYGYVISFQAPAVISTNEANVYENPALWASNGGHMGVFFLDDGAKKIKALHHDGTFRTVEAAVSVSTSYELAVRYDKSTTTFGAKLHGGSWDEDATTSDLTSPAAEVSAFRLFMNLNGNAAGTGLAKIRYFASFTSAPSKDDCDGMLDWLNANRPVP